MLMYYIFPSSGLWNINDRHKFPMSNNVRDHRVGRLTMIKKGLFQSICFLSFSLVFLVLLSHFCYVPLVLLSDLYIKQKLFNVRFWKFLRMVIWRQSDLRESKLWFWNPFAPEEFLLKRLFWKAKNLFTFLTTNQSGS